MTCERKAVTFERSEREYLYQAVSSHYAVLSKRDNAKEETALTKLSRGHASSFDDYVISICDTLPSRPSSIRSMSVSPRYFVTREITTDPSLLGLQTSD